MKQLTYGENTKMNNFVISLRDNNEKRRAHITEQFSGKNIPFEFFNAINKTQLHVADELGVTFDNPNLSPGEKGCFLSHITLWKKIIDEDITVAGIFEDDIYLSKESEKALSSYDWVSNKLDVIKIEKSSEKVKTSVNPVIRINNNINIFRLNSKNLGTAGYIITNKGARYLLNKITTEPLKNPIDHDMFNDFLLDDKYIACQSLPALCIQDFVFNNTDANFPSLLENNRIHRKTESKDISKNKLLRELNRVAHQVKDFVFQKVIERKIKFNM
ncbi:glycosyltransferase family 25 protein [Morganella sp. GD04133]|uniref:glycosyltransferase family 25 protein n=1 Tax=Morganella sp. GD04133 TaxID=2975435 RepID=UPI0024498519|nr:glycosyltransferase family 25 protein [Morganella sp. GD04133]MDH0356563.1 glycosyltransferase family 25 protein [Morganella sp. GD04133]